MACNIGTIDRIVRVLLGIAAIGAWAYAGGWWGLIGFVLLVTAAVKWCALYRLLGISTCGAHAEQIQ